MADSVELWIEWVGGDQLLHHFPDCAKPHLTVALMGAVRDSECSGTYAVENRPPWTVLGDVCQLCRIRFLAQGGNTP